MSNDATLPPAFFDMLRNEILPELLGAGEDSLAAYEQGRTPDGTSNFTNYMLGCAYWDNSFTRLKRTCVGGESFFKHSVYNNVLEVYTTIDGKRISFYISRVHPDSRIPRSGKGIKRLLHAQIFQDREFLSSQIKEIVRCFGIYTIGVDLDAENGIGKVTFDMLLPASDNGCYALTCETLYDATIPTISATIPEHGKKPIVTRSSSKGLAKPAHSDREPAPERLEKKKLKRNQQDFKPAEKAKK